MQINKYLRLWFARIAAAILLISIIPPSIEILIGVVLFMGNLFEYLKTGKYYNEIFYEFINFRGFVHIEHFVGGSEQVNNVLSFIYDCKAYKVLIVSGVLILGLLVPIYFRSLKFLSACEEDIVS